MDNYQKMYTTLFNKITDAIALLQTAQVESEEMFLEHDEPTLALLGNNKNQDEE